MPYPVATIANLEQRAYINVDNGNTPEWLFSRVHKFCTIAKDPTRLLRDNQASLKDTFCNLQVNIDVELHYRGQQRAEADTAPWSEHTLGSAGLLAFLLWVIKNRALKAINKAGH